MPNNSSARREKDKKKKDRKNKDNKKTDTPPLPKEDTASVDSRSLPLALSSEEQEEQDLSIALDRMEKAMQEHATREAGELDWKNADWAWARTALRVRHFQSLTVDESTELGRKLREEIRSSNPLVSREELKSQLDFAMLRKALEWRKSVRQGEKDSLSGKDKSSAGVHPLSPSLAGIQSAPEGRAISDQPILDEHQRMIIRFEYLRTITVDERLEIKGVIRAEHGCNRGGAQSHLR
jgi:hypothetical protein